MTIREAEKVIVEAITIDPLVRSQSLRWLWGLSIPQGMTMKETNRVDVTITESGGVRIIWGDACLNVLSIEPRLLA